MLLCVAWASCSKSSFGLNGSTSNLRGPQANNTHANVFWGDRFGAVTGQFLGVNGGLNT
jgi:hypothetical protein